MRDITSRDAGGRGHEFNETASATIAQAINVTASKLEQSGVDEARLLAQYALAEVTGIERMRLNEYGAELVNGDQKLKLDAISSRLARHEPLQYVLGYTEFMGRRFKADKRALIPRPETEELVQRVLNEHQLWERPNPHIVDVGTGSGCIAITLAIEHKNARITATDYSPLALELGRENENAHGLDSVDWVCADLLDMPDCASADAVVSNPPYIASAQLDKLDRNIREHEPRQALDGGASGLEIVARLIGQALNVLRRGGWIFLEIGEDQGDAVAQILAEKDLLDIEIRKDLAGHDRIAVART